MPEQVQPSKTIQPNQIKKEHAPIIKNESTPKKTPKKVKFEEQQVKAENLKSEGKEN